eukprot:gene67079-91868_t
MSLSSPSSPDIKFRTISPERREWIKRESEKIMQKNLLLREKSKEMIFEKRIEQLKINQMGREQQMKKWQEKTKNSPFAVNLVAEDERIFEETSIREKEETERKLASQTAKETAKNEIIMKALGEFSELEALRREKRAILDEEQRLKALLTLEKVSVHGKADRLVAERAQKQRKDAKFQHRRAVYKDS